jgi:hypothetical protein
VAEEEDSEAKKVRLEQEAARDLAWDAAVAVALEEMREPERREWFRDQRIQEEQKSKKCTRSHRA